MRVSTLFNETLKEVPKDVQIPSHRLMVRAGMIQQVASGIYSYLPLAHRSLKKIEAIVRDELDKAGCQEVLLPMVQPRELWDESRRWGFYGPELLRFTDRKGGEFCLGPTHEELITDMVKKILKSYKQLPWNLYQIQTKFRDELRPRFGLLRGREFLMKDAYSFDVDEEAAKAAYWKMYHAYDAIFKRCGLAFRAVDAATGNIGGNMSHEFQVLTETGEDEILSCTRCEYTANKEKAFTVPSATTVDPQDMLECEEVFTPSKRKIEEVAEFLNAQAQDFLKALVYVIDNVPTLVLIRGDLDVNEPKLQSLLGASQVSMAGDEVILEKTGSPAGFVGPIGLTGLPIVADLSVTGMLNFFCGRNKEGYHYKNANYGRDFKADKVGDIGFARGGDPCPRCDGGLLEAHRGIEVGHIFYLGTKYSEALGCKYLDQRGDSQAAFMGCYGIGIGRTLAAAIEQSYDENGIIWPLAIAPYEVVILPLQAKVEEVQRESEALYRTLCSQGVDVALDDRDERPGIKFKDADLLGYPLQIIIGERNLHKGQVEVKERRTGKICCVSLEGLHQFVRNFLSPLAKN